MKVSINLGIAATLIAAVATTDAANTPASRVVGYYTSSTSSLNTCQSQSRPLSDIDTSLYTHLVYSRGSIDPSTFVLVPGSDESWSNVANIKRNATDLKVLLALSDVQFSSSSNDTSTFGHLFKAMLTGSGNEPINAIEAQKRQTTFINSLSSTLTKYGFDGVDIDWAGETLSASAYSKIGVHDELAMFLGNLKNKLSDKLITYTVSGSSQAMSDLGLCPQHTSTCFPRGLAAASHHLDFINLKGFDLHSHVNVTSPSSALTHASPGSLFGSSVDSVISTFTANGFEAQYLNLAMGLHGKSYTLATGPALQSRLTMLKAKQEQGVGYYLPAASTSQDSCSTPSYNQIKIAANTSSYSAHFDKSTSTSYMYNSNDRTFITYDDPKSLQHKANMMTHRQLGGIGFYGIEMDTSDNEFQRNVLSSIKASCPADGSFPRTVQGATASITCPDHSSLTRTCGPDGAWTTKVRCGQASTQDRRRRLYSSPEKRDAPVCNGASTNCDLPINKLTLPSTHNSGSAPFYFPDPLPQFVQDLTLATGEGLLQCAFNNQDKGLDVQVQDGIRGFDFELCYNLNMSTSSTSGFVGSILSGDSTFTVPVDCHGPGVLGNFDILIDAYGYRMDDAFRLLQSTANAAQDVLSIRLSSSPVASTADQVHHDTITIFADTFCNGDNANCPAAIKNYGARNVTAGQSLANGANVLLLWQDDDWVNSNGYGSWVTNEAAVVQRTWSDPPINVNDVGSHVAEICSGQVTLPLDLDLYGKYDPSALLTCLDTLAGANQANGTSVSSFVQQMTTQTCNGKDVAAIHLDRYEIFQSSDSQGRTFAAWVNEYNAGKPR